MTLMVDINHWLDENGELPTRNLRVRRNALRIVRFIEYGGTLKQREGRETLIECKKRPRGKSCLGLMWVAKLNDDRLEAHCPACNELEAIVSGWQDTLWADGIAIALPMTDD